jgi:transcriptional regulator with XRE-family HTH domain
LRSEDLNRLIGLRVRRRRRQLGLTQAQLAAVCGVRFQQVQKYESGAPLTAVRLWLIAEALEVPVAYFFEGVANSSPEEPERLAPDRPELRESAKRF